MIAASWGPLLTAFATSYSFSLDDFQIEGCQQVEDGCGVLVAAPTGAGKTIVGEFAVACAIARGVKCFYTTPIKALSNQKFHDLVERYGADKVGLLTGDASINSDADIVVMTTEVLRNMIYANSTTLDRLGYVVMDEVHYLADRFRGAVWEEVIIGLAASVQLIALSATVSNAEEFGEWLDTVRGNVKIVVSERRPVPLFQQMLVRKKLYDLFAGVAPTAQTLAPGEKPANHSEVNPSLVRLAKDESRLVRDDARNPRGRSGRGKQGSHSRYGGQANARFAGRSAFTTSRRDMVEALGKAKLLPAICFVFSRTGCDGAVRQLLGCYTDLTTDYEKREIDVLLGQYTARLSDEDLRALDFDWFAEGLRRGIAAHHAGLLPAFKECVEAAFVRGLAKIVFATDTLALGINMPAKSVVIEKLTKYNGETHADITPGEYTQLTGRAGRRGIDVDGHAIVVWQPGVEPRAVAGLASKRTYPLRSSFSPTYNMAVNLVGAVGRDRARGLLEQSFAQFQSDRSVVGVSRRLQHLEQEVATSWAQVHCDQGDFEHYARLRGEISAIESQIAHERKADRRAETYTILQDLAPGDLIYIPSGKKRGWAAVVANPRGQRGELHLSVMTQTRQVVKAGLVDFPTPPVLGGKIRVPKYFDVRDASSRRAVAAALQARLPQLVEPNRWKDAPVDDDTEARLLSARVELRAHPCHSCPDRELHARAAEQALRLEREVTTLRSQTDSRTQTIARKFDKICLVLEALGYLDEDGRQVTDEGKMLARIYNELDLVAAQALRLGVFNDLTGPQLAAVLSTLVYESRVDGRVHRMPDRASEKAQSALRAVRRDVGLLERDHRLERGRELDIGFAEAVYAWAAGDDLADVLFQSGLVAGDFVRWVRQVIDFCGQIGDAAGPGPVRDAARAAVRQLRRGVVDVDGD